MLLTILVPLFLFLQATASSLADSGLSDLLAGSSHLEELYGSGEFKYNNNQVESQESHYAYSFLSLLGLFQVERRFVAELGSLYNILEEKIQTEDWRSQLVFSARLTASPQVADSEFLTGPPVSLYRLQTLHQISPSDLTAGRLGPYPSSPSLPSSPHRLTWQDSVLVAEKAGLKNDLVGRVEWLQVAVELCQEEEEGEGDCQSVKTLLDEAIQTHDKIALSHGKFVISKTFPLLTRIVPFNQTLAERHSKRVARWQRKFSEYVARFPMFAESEEAPADIFFADSVVHTEKISAQCRDLPDSPFLPRLGDARLRCSLLHRSLPHLRLGPVQLETLSVSPGVAALHGLLSPGQCRELRERGREGMKVTPFTLSQAAGQANTYSDRRMSKVRYLSHRRDPLASQINRKLSHALDLDLDGAPIPAENYQLMNYGLGGYIELHQDSNIERGGGVEGGVEYSQPRDWLVGGERLLTVLLYLSPPTGGHTVFPLLGLSSAPRPGTALVWHTIDTRGRPRQTMKHLGCPVVLGDKWILNKWVKWHHHMFSHPCHVNRQFYSVG